MTLARNRRRSGLCHLGEPIATRTAADSLNGIGAADLREKGVDGLLASNPIAAIPQQLKPLFVVNLSMAAELFLEHLNRNFLKALPPQLEVCLLQTKLRGAAENRFDLAEKVFIATELVSKAGQNRFQRIDLLPLLIDSSY